MERYARICKALCVCGKSARAYAAVASHTTCHNAILTAEFQGAVLIDQQVPIQQPPTNLEPTSEVRVYDNKLSVCEGSGQFTTGTGKYMLLLTLEVWVSTYDPSCHCYLTACLQSAAVVD